MELTPLLSIAQTRIKLLSKLLYVYYGFVTIVTQETCVTLTCWMTSPWKRTCLRVILQHPHGMSHTRPHPRVSTSLFLSPSRFQAFFTHIFLSFLALITFYTVLYFLSIYLLPLSHNSYSFKQTYRGVILQVLGYYKIVFP